MQSIMTVSANLVDAHSFLAMDARALYAKHHTSVSAPGTYALLTTYTRALYAKQHTRVNAPWKVHSFLALHTRSRVD